MTVSNDEPTTDEAVTVTPTVSLSSQKDGGFEITQVILTAPDQGRVDEADDLGVIGSGESIDVPLQTTFDTAGEKRLVVTVRGVRTDANGSTQKIGVIERPVYVSVSEPSSNPVTEPQLQITTDRAVAGSDVPVTVTVSNGDDNALTDLALRLESDGTVEDPTRVWPTLGARNMTTVEFNVQPENVGSNSLETTLEYNSGSHVTATQSMQVEPLREDVDLYAFALERNGSTVLQYRVTNRGNAPIDDVSISGQTNDTQLPSATIETVDATSAQTVTIPVNDALVGTAQIEAMYTVGDRTAQTGQSINITEPTATKSETGTNGEQSITTAGGLGGLPFAGVGIALIGLVSVGLVGYRQWDR
ncbi:transglutaminase [Haloterrigena sp. H1]|uniref:transglutaminase n=1 Tax=Haloterrigena sp. H1 TaxID=2552943 RepID=UPI0020175474|nr:transglutaminase [Haloterrigena sp. H1]